jgi:hypothetical protein
MFHIFKVWGRYNRRLTDHRHCVVRTSASFQDVTSSVLGMETGNLTEVFYRFPPYLQAHSGILSSTGARLVLAIVLSNSFCSDAIRRCKRR